MPARTLALVACLLLFLGPAACGGKNKQEEEAARKAVTRLYRALAAKDARTVCKLLSRQGKRELARAVQSSGRRQNCESLFQFALAFSTGLERTADSKVTDVSVDGDEARAKVKNKRQEGDVLLVKENGAWKLSGLGLK